MYKFIFKIFVYPFIWVLSSKWLLNLIIWPFMLIIKIEFFYKSIKFRMLKNNPKAFERDFATVVFKDMTKIIYFDNWIFMKDKIKKNFYDKGLCKIL